MNQNCWRLFFATFCATGISTFLALDVYPSHEHTHLWLAYVVCVEAGVVVFYAVLALGEMLTDVRKQLRQIRERHARINRRMAIPIDHETRLRRAARGRLFGMPKWWGTRS